MSRSGGRRGAEREAWQTVTAQGGGSRLSAQKRLGESLCTDPLSSVPTV